MTITRDGGPGAAWALAWFSFTVGTGVDIFPVLLLFFAYSITVRTGSEIRSIRQRFAHTHTSVVSFARVSAALAPCQRSKHEAAAARARALTHHFTHSLDSARVSITYTSHDASRSIRRGFSLTARKAAVQHAPSISHCTALAAPSTTRAGLSASRLTHHAPHTNRRTATSGSAHTKPSIHQRVIAAANVHPSRARLGHPRAHLQPLSQSAHPPAASSSAYTLDTISSSRALALHSQLPPASCLK